MSETWYPVTSDCPRVGIPVLVQWAGRQFRAARWPIKGSNDVAWVSIINGERQWLPPAKEAARWGDEPDAWRPENPEQWRAPLPAPLIAVVPRMWSSRQSFQAVDDASSADLAREMEQARESARASTDIEFESEEFATQWWRDATQITYSSPGQVSKREAEGRIMRALSWCGAGAGLTLHARTPQTILSAIADFMDGMDEPSLTRFRPLNQDHDDFDVAMAWFSKLYPPDFRGRHHRAWSFNRVQKVLLWRARPVPVSFVKIAKRFGISKQAAIGLYSGTPKQAGAIDRVWRAANDLPVYPQTPVVDHMAALRERNRRARVVERS